MLAIVFRDLLLFAAALGGLILPAWRWLAWAQGVERLALAMGAALLAGYLALFSLYAAGLPLRWFWILPLVGLGFSLLRPGAAPGPWRDAAVRGVVGRWLLLSLWCLGWQGLVVSYSGGGWMRDWVEHYDRAQFFLQHWPGDFLFVGVYPLPARPPLLNIWTAGLMAQTGGAFTHYQVITTLLSTVVMFPLMVLLRRWRDDDRAANLLLLMMMLSPMLVQNATFPWTKLGCAFFVLLAITQLSPSAGEPTRARLIAGAVLLAGGMLAHYSAGSWICALVAAGAWINRARWREPGFRRSVLMATACAAALGATWIGWALAVYGPVTTFTANTALAMAPGGTLTERVLRAATNLWFTLVPVAGSIEWPELGQTSPLGAWRDHWFALYQLKLSFALGSAGCAVILWLLLRLKWSRETGYWLIAVPLVVVLGTATVSQPELRGLAHIALQPLVLLGLVWLAAQAQRLPRWLAVVWAAGLAVDLTLGIFLHFTLQSFWLDRWLHPGLSTPQYLAVYNTAARMNWQDKSDLHLTFLADVIAPAACAILVLAAGLTAGILYGRSLAHSKTG